MSNIIKVNFQDGEVKGIGIDNDSIKYYELKQNIEELFKFKKSFKQKEVVALSKISDVMYDLMFLGINKNSKEILFKVC
jgi:hypothetical protein